jgi:carboxyl-terminal processing protease
MPMRWILPWFAVPLFLGLALATDPVRNSQPARAGLDRTEAQRYAIQLQEILVRVMQRYVRPVECEELANAAVKGLYEAAPAPVPANLQAQVNAAAKEGRLISFFVQTREALGDADGLRGQRAIVASIQGMTKALDQFCALVPAEDGLRATVAENAYGIGLEFSEPASAGALIVKSVALGSPAQRAGIRPGDQITHVNGQPADKSASARAVGTEETRFVLRVTRPGSSRARSVDLRSESFRRESVAGVSRRTDNSWEFFIAPKDKIAQVRILSFDANASEELPQILHELLAANMRGLILDLRWCPGGYLDDSRTVAAVFLGSYNPAFFVLPAPGNWMAVADAHLDNHCKNASVWYRDGRPDPGTKRVDVDFIGIPMVILVNAETSGGAELVAAVLQDNHRAMIVGQRTRGKGSVQQPFKLGGEDVSMPLTIPIPSMKLNLSTGLLIRPSGKNLNRYPDSKPSDDWGVRPDPGLEFRLSPDLDHRLRDWWQAQNLRPGSSNESLPLDDPTNDPQRQAAIDLLLRALR